MFLNETELVCSDDFKSNNLCAFRSSISYTSSSLIYIKESSCDEDNKVCTEVGGGAFQCLKRASKQHNGQKCYYKEARTCK